MTLRRSRCERGGVRHRDQQLQRFLWCLVRRSHFSQAFAPETQFAGRSEPETHCLTPEGSRLDRSHAVNNPV
jgi:hypothetical protein